MKKTVTVHGNVRMLVEVNPIDVIQNILPIPAHDWIVTTTSLEHGMKYIQMTEESAGQHSHEVEVGEVTKEIYDTWMAKKTLIKFLTKTV